MLYGLCRPDGAVEATLRPACMFALLDAGDNASSASGFSDSAPTSSSSSGEPAAKDRGCAAEEIEVEASRGRAGVALG